MPGAAMEDSMAVDVVLWFILAAMAGWIWLGCIFTAPRRTPAKTAEQDSALKLDRAA